MGLGNIKVNMVVKRGTNDHEILPMARHFRGTGIVLRFIEYMDVGATNGWQHGRGAACARWCSAFHAELPLAAALAASAPAKRQSCYVSYADGGGEIGDQQRHAAFCGDCNRARLSTEGPALPVPVCCHGHDLRAGARRRNRRSPGLGHRPHLAGTHRPLPELRSTGGP